MTRRLCALVLSGVLLIVTPCLADPKEDVAATTAKWASAFAELNADKIAGLYAKDAVLWGTVAPILRSTPEAIREYFSTAVKGRSNMKVIFEEQLVRVYGDTAINSGRYTFSYVLNGEQRTVPGRYSFTYVKAGSDWLIVDHHSSAMPPAPR
jgi:uncharacterized protein (TIGR02246 family)